MIILKIIMMALTFLPFLQNDNHVIYLKNSEVEVGILPNAGGRIVSFKLKGKDNILKSNPANWYKKFNKKTVELIDNTIVPFNGHIVWVGPQKHWWQHQDIYSDLKENKSEWPPDPFLIYAQNEIIEHSIDQIKLKGVKSEISGIQLTKEISIDDSGKLYFKVVGENITDNLISWDLWLNTRLDGFSKVYVPIKSESDIRFTYLPVDGFERMPYKIEKGYFSFDTNHPQNGIEIEGKAYIYPAVNFMFAFTENEMFIIEFEKYDKDLVHPYQGMVEIYNSVKENGDALLELEYHTPYKTLNPGDKMIGKEIWHIFEYDNSKHSHLEFIHEFLINHDT